MFNARGIETVQHYISVTGSKIEKMHLLGADVELEALVDRILIAVQKAAHLCGKFAILITFGARGRENAATHLVTKMPFSRKRSTPRALDGLDGKRRLRSEPPSLFLHSGC